MHYETINTQAKIAELLHASCTARGVAGNHDLGDCPIRAGWVPASAAFLGKLMPTIVEEIVPQVREDEQERLGTNAALLSCSTMGEAFDRMEQTLAELATARREAEQARELLHEAWGVIANAENFKHTLRCDASHCVEGDHILDLDNPVPIGPQEWRDAAYRWRDHWHSFTGKEDKDTPAAAPKVTSDCGYPIEHKRAIITRHSRECAQTQVAQRFAAAFDDEWLEPVMPDPAGAGADDLDAHIAEQMTDPAFAAAYRARQAAALKATSIRPCGQPGLHDPHGMCPGITLRSAPTVSGEMGAALCADGIHEAEYPCCDERAYQLVAGAGDGEQDATCGTCGGGIWYQDCPAGGWWIHDQHPVDGHDAEPFPADDGELFPDQTEDYEPRCGNPECAGYHCGSCGDHTGQMGHYAAFCQVTRQRAPHHFCCPDDCELHPAAPAVAAPDADSGESYRSCGCLTNGEGAHRGDCPEWETLEDRNGRYWLRRVAADGGVGS